MLDALGEDAKVLSGGQSLVPMLALRLAYYEHLVDISRLQELCGVASNGQVRVGATTTETAVGSDPVVAQEVPLLARATPLIGHVQIRNRGTLGGSIAHADPAAEYALVARTLDAEMECLSVRGVRSIPAEQFFLGLWQTALEPDEILAAVHFPVRQGRYGCAVKEFARRHGDYAVAGAAVTVRLDQQDRVEQCAIGLLGVGARPERASAAEQELLGRPVGEFTGQDVGRLATEALDEVPSDLHGPAEYRVRVAAAMVAEAWDDAVREVLGG